MIEQYCQYLVLITGPASEIETSREVRRISVTVNVLRAKLLSFGETVDGGLVLTTKEESLPSLEHLLETSRPSQDVTEIAKLIDGEFKRAILAWSNLIDGEAGGGLGNTNGYRQVIGAQWQLCLSGERISLIAGKTNSVTETEKYHRLRDRATAADQSLKSLARNVANLAEAHSNIRIRDYERANLVISDVSNEVTGSLLFQEIKDLKVDPIPGDILDNLRLLEQKLIDHYKQSKKSAPN